MSRGLQRLKKKKEKTEEVLGLNLNSRKSFPLLAFACAFKKNPPQGFSLEPHAHASAFSADVGLRLIARCSSRVAARHRQRKGIFFVGQSRESRPPEAKTGAERLELIQRRKTAAPWKSILTALYLIRAKCYWLLYLTHNQRKPERTFMISPPSPLPAKSYSI